jgi:hypothetical protein
VRLVGEKYPIFSGNLPSPPSQFEAIFLSFLKKENIAPTKRVFKILNYSLEKKNHPLLKGFRDRKIEKFFTN